MRKLFMKRMWLLMFAFLLIGSPIVDAAKYFQVNGDSMSPTLNHGDVVEIDSDDYQEGDIVVARLKNGRMVVKRLQEEGLKGDNPTSRTYDIESVDEILGKAEFHTQSLTEEEIAAFEKVFADGDMKISGGIYHTLAINANGELYSWGRNDYGQLGHGDSTTRYTPQQIGTATNWTQVSAGQNHSLAVNSNGELYSWGSNNSGQLGLGNSINTYSPTKVGTATNWIDVVGGGDHTLLINSNGELYSMGENGYGQLGLGDWTDRNTPTQVGTGTNWTQIGAGLQHSVAINSNGELYSWGLNTKGQLGLGHNWDRAAPEQVGTATNWTQVGAGYQHSVAINANGELYSWGWNSNSQLGLGDTTDRNTPTQVGTETNWTQVSSGDYHVLVINANGELYSWGYNPYGQLGSGDTTNRNTPTQVGTETNWTQVSSGGMFSLGINLDGELYSWGHDGYGQLGHGGTGNKNTPTLVSGFLGFIFNQAPEISVSSPTESDLIVSENSLFKLDLTVSDPDGDNVSWDLTLPQSGMVYKDGTTVSGNPITASCPSTCSFSNIFYLDPAQFPESDIMQTMTIIATDTVNNTASTKEFSFKVKNTP